MKERLLDIQRQLLRGLIEREEPVRLTLLAALTGEHLLLLGRPGTAKSELARRLKSVFSGGHYFERLLTRFSVPEELFGPLSIKALEDDRYERLTDSYLPSASIAFIDEIFKANSAILNSLLTLLNEREFDNGAQRLKTPLIAVIAASNELPAEEGLDALYDRFLLRYLVEPVSDAGFSGLLLLDERPKEPELERLISEDIEAIQSQAEKIQLSTAVVDMLKAMRGFLQDHAIYVSDRRWRKVIHMLKIAAVSNEQNEVNAWDCWLLQHCLWDRPEQKPLIKEWLQRHLGTHDVSSPERINRLLDTWQETLDEELAATTPVLNDHGAPLYLDPEGHSTTDAKREIHGSHSGDPLYLAPPDQADRTNNGHGYIREELERQFFDDHYQQCHIDGQWVRIQDYVGDSNNRLRQFQDNEPCVKPVLYSQGHVTNRQKEVSQILDDVQHYEDRLSAQLDELRAIENTHLWIGREDLVLAQIKLSDNQQTLVDLSARFKKINEAFGRLPLNLGA